MKTLQIVAAIAAVTISAVASAPAFAQNDVSSRAQGHYEWQQARQRGPRAPLQGLTRIWVPDALQMASCDCDTMTMSRTGAADCMKTMHGAIAVSGPSPS